MRVFATLGGLFLLGCSAPEFQTVNPQDSGTADTIGVQDGAFPDAQSDTAPAESGPACNEVIAFDAPVSADTHLDANYPSTGAANNGGALDELLVASAVTLPSPTAQFVALMRFKLTMVPAGAELLSLSLKVTTVSPATPSAGSARVYFTRSEWSEGTGAYDGATWANRVAVCTGCPGGAPENGCCTYTETWHGAGATAPKDRAALPAANVDFSATPGPVEIALDLSTLGNFGVAAITVQVVAVPDDATKVWLAAHGRSGAAVLTGTYCAPI
ncbi:MAG TPA: hypothetical protein PKA88_15175 [Polyangiaceae bacterium]|nr:hypothetical protein [Polyangiaceae bacterium]